MDELSPLFDRLTAHNALGRSSFHTPGHKGGFFDSSLLQLDYTELPDTDALYEAEGVILQTERNAAKLFGVNRSLISAGGCSLAIQTMLRLIAARGKKILCARNAHRSAVNAMALLGLEPIWMIPEGENGYTGRITAERVQALLQVHEDVAGCYLTSPSYYGEISDIAAIAQVCHRKGTALLVDNAHGSHLAFMHKNMHPAHLGADMTACSLHKTLPVLTGGALLNITEPSFAADAKQAMALFGSTSPSYLIMSSIDLCIRYMFETGMAEYRKCEEQVAELKAMAAKKGIRQPNGFCDPLRLTLHTAGMTAETQYQFFEEHQIDCEFCDGMNAVLLCTPWNTNQDFERVRQAIRDLPPSFGKEKTYAVVQPEKVISLRQAILAETEIVTILQAKGRIAADTACPCPPGVPIVMPGERIDVAVVDALRESGIERIKVVKNADVFSSQPQHCINKTII